MPVASSPPAEICDVLVVGGGINGCGIARDLAGRGWSVVLCEKDDLASHTSSSSTKLIHGGLRYLEHGEFSLVRKALQEREVLMRSAPHLIRPLRFVVPHDPAMRPAWMIRIGLWLYDHLARRDALPGSRTIALRSHAAGRPLKSDYAKGFLYWDGWVDDARLVVLNAIDARERGARILTRTRCVEARREATRWIVMLDGAGGRRSLTARVVVNAAGPWAESFLRDAMSSSRISSRHLRLVKGSHIVVRRLFDHGDAYLFQNADRRIIFAIPYERDYTLIGTTDVELDGVDPASATASDAEIAYLCEQASRYFLKPVVPADVEWSFSGVRPLLDDAAGNAAAVTRDYHLDADTDGAPLLSVWGGKITTFRRLAEEAGDEVGRMVGDRRPAWTRDACLPGGDLSARFGTAVRNATPQVAFAAFVARVVAEHRWLDGAVVRRLVHAYGTRVEALLGGASCLADLGEEVMPGLFERELDYLRREEWTASGEDVLWRRSKLGLHATQAGRDAVEAWMKARGSSTSSPVPSEAPP